MSAPASRPDLLRLLAQSIFGEQARLFPWEEKRPVELDSTRPAELRPAQRERPSDIRDMNMSELERLITEQEEAQKAGAAEAIHNMPASPVAGLVAAVSPETYSNMASSEGPGGEAPTMAAALTGLETTGGPGHPLTPRVEPPAPPGGRVRPARIAGIPLPDPRMKGMSIDNLKNEHMARWWDKFERAQETGPVALEKARDAAKKDWDVRFRTWQVSNEPPAPSVIDQDFVIPSEGSAAGVEPTMFQPAKAARPAGAASSEPKPAKPEKPKFIDPSAVSIVTEPMPEPPPGGITVEPIEGKPGTWRIRDPKSGLEQEFTGDRETADKHAKWLAQLSLRAEAREKLKAAKATEKPKTAEAPKPAEPAPEPAPEPEPAKPAASAEPPISDAEAAKLIEARNQPEPGFEQDPTPERVAEMMTAEPPPAPEPPSAPAPPAKSVPDEPASVVKINKEMERLGRGERLYRSPSGYYYWSGGASGKGDGAWESIPMYRISDLPMSRIQSEIIEPNIKASGTAESTEPGARLEFKGLKDQAIVGDPEPPTQPPVKTGLPTPGSQMTRAQAEVGMPVESIAGKKGVIVKIPTSSQNDGTVTVMWSNGSEGRIQVSNLKPPAMTTGGGSLAPQGLPPTRGQRTPKNSPPAPVVGRRSSKKAEPPAKPAAKLSVPEAPAPSGPPGETNLTRTLGLKYTPPTGKGQETTDYRGNKMNLELWEGIEPAQKKQMLKNKELFDRILAGMPVKESEYPSRLRGPRKSEAKLEGASVQEYLKALGKDVEDVNPASINWDQYNARQNAEFGSRTGLKDKPEGPTFSPAPEPPAAEAPADTAGADAFHSKLMGALEKRVMGNKAGTVSGKKAPGQTGKKFSKPIPESTGPSNTVESRDRATTFEALREGRDNIVEGRDSDGKVVFRDQYQSMSMAKEIAEDLSAKAARKKK